MVDPGVVDTSVGAEGRVGSIKTGQEFVLNGMTFKRVGYYLYGVDSPIRERLYPFTLLPNAKDGKPLDGHQNCVLVQEKETGAFFFAECWDRCEVIEDKPDATGGMTVTDNWAGDNVKQRILKGEVVDFDDANGWNDPGVTPRPLDRPVWVITEYQRRCIVHGRILVKWSLIDEKCVLWHPSEVGDECEPPDFPVGFRVEKELAV